MSGPRSTARSRGSRLRALIRGAVGDWLPRMELLARIDRYERLTVDGRVTVGPHTYGWPEIETFDGDVTRVHIGAYCSIAKNVKIIAGGNHNPGWVSTFPFRAQFGLPGAYEDGQPSSRGDIVIGSDVWLGYRATLLSGVTIGHGAIIGAGAVVARDIAPYAIAAGNPAEIRRYRFPEETIRRLLALAWWEWPEEVIAESIPLLSADLTEAGLIRLEMIGEQVRGLAGNGVQVG